MTKRISATTKFYLLIVLMLPFFLTTVVTDDERYLFSYFIILGIILIFNPTLFFKAFAEEAKRKNFYHNPETIDVDSSGPKAVYGCLGVVGGVFFIIVGIIKVLTSHG